MSSDRIKEVFAEVADAAPEERAAVLDRLCPQDDNDIRARIQRLLAAHDAAGGGGFMAEPTAHPDTPPIGGEAGAEIGQTLGAFTLEKVIGEGGFGTVYLGRQEAPIQRCAAVKVLKPGMDSRQVIARFETERQTLAMMEHEGIAKVIDAGTTAAGRPFVAMEYVEGSYITDYCDQRRLSIDERLRLFERICLAVQHAHQKGVIHRDLKPSNILVAEIDGRPAPKIIDFGIAKALEAGQIGAGTRGSASRLTGGHQLLGTPEYMSPEQAAGGSDVDTRTDVYSLGVLLYELLCGAPPFDRQLLRKAGPAQLERILQEDRPGRPSGRIGPGREDLEQAAAARRTDPPRLRRQLKGDLDWIVMRTLEKDRERRYPTAYALSADIRRALHHKPVEAGPPSFAYIAGKFLKRHRGPAAGIMVAALLILGALALAITGFWRASSEGERAEVALEDARRQLNVALVAQARAMRRSDAPGRRADSLDAIARAAEYEVSAELRSEAIATLALDDIRLDREIEVGPLATGLGLDRVDRVAVAPGPGSDARTIRILSLETGEAITELAAPEGAQALLRFSPDGRYFAARFWRDRVESLRIWEVESGRIALAIEGFEPDALAFGGDWSPRPWVAVGRGDGRLEIYSLGGESGPEGELLGALPVTPGWKTIAASRDGRLLAVNVYEDLAVDLYRVEAGAPGAPYELLGQFRADSPMLSLELNDAGDVLAAGCADFSIALWATAAPGSPAHEIRGHQGQPVTLEFAPGSVMLASAGWDNTVRLWDLSRLEPVIGPIENWGLAGYGESLVTRRGENVGIWQQRAASEVTTRVVPGRLGVRAQVAISPATEAESDPRWIATGGEEGARLWTLDGSMITRITQQETLGVEFLSASPHEPDRILTLHTDGVRLWRILRDGETVSVAPHGQRAGGRGARPGAGETGMLWPMAGDSRMAMVDDSTVVVAGPEGLVLIDCNTGELLRTLDPHQGIATAPSVALVGEGGRGNLAFTGNWKGPAGMVRDLETGEVKLEIAAEHVVGCFTPDGSSLIIGTGAHFTCYDTATWRQRWRIERNNSDSLAGVLACSADGSLLALGRSRFALDLVDPRTGEVIATLDSPDRRALGEVAFSADGNWLAIATTSDLLQIIDLAGIRKELADLGLDWERGDAVSR